MQAVKIGNVACGGDAPLLLITGPCQIESADHALYCAEALAKIAASAGMGFVYKSSYDKANRTSAGAARGIGIDSGLEILAMVKAKIGVPVLSDVHLPEQCLRPLRFLTSFKSQPFYVGKLTFSSKRPKPDV